MEVAGVPTVGLAAPKINGDKLFMNSSLQGCRTMLHITRVKGFKLVFYDLLDKKYITANHVTRFFGCQLVRAIKGLP